MNFKIRAFGACLIGGFHLGYENSCFRLATERRRRETALYVAVYFALEQSPRREMLHVAEPTERFHHLNHG